MSSSIFAANNKFVSVLTGKTYDAGTPAFYLTCAGNVAVPGKQIEASKKDTGFETGYRIVVVGHEWKRGRGGRNYRKAIFGWEQKVGREWRKVTTWSNMVAVEEAKALGFKVPGRATTAMKGKRTVGVEHEVSDEVTEVEETTEEAVAKAEELLAKLPDPTLPALPGTSLEDAAKAFASWG